MAERQNRVKRLEREEMEIEEDIHNLLGMEILRNLLIRDVYPGSRIQGNNTPGSVSKNYSILA
jgi:hypothetical protein